jgi:chemotaxis protein MotB
MTFFAHTWRNWPNSLSGQPSRVASATLKKRVVSDPSNRIWVNISLSDNWSSAMSVTTIRNGLFLLLVTAFLTGCHGGQQDRMGLLEDENFELRARNQQLQASLSQAEQARSLLDQEAQDLRAENDQLKLDGSGGYPAGANTGFEGLAGVTTSTNASGEVIVAVAGDVLFDSGKVALKSSAKKTLDQIVQVLNDRYSGRMIRIAGHTDSDPIKKSQWKTNERLSAERAMAVEAYLAKKGVDGDRMYSAAFGPSQPKGNKKSSRRVEIVVLNLPAS